jgi:hypothetical protein
MTHSRELLFGALQTGAFPYFVSYNLKDTQTFKKLSLFLFFLFSCDEPYDKYMIPFKAVLFLCTQGGSKIGAGTRMTSFIR